MSTPLPAILPMPRAQPARSVVDPLRIRHHAVSIARSTSTGRCASGVAGRSGRRTAASCSIRWPRERSRSPTIRSRMSTSPIRRCCRRCDVWSKACQVSSTSTAATERTHNRPRSSPLWRTDRDGGCPLLVHLLLLEGRPPAPDFARTVEIHRKPGYDPVELFLDPAHPAPKPRSASACCCASSGFAR